MIAYSHAAIRSGGVRRSRARGVAGKKKLIGTDELCWNASGQAASGPVGDGFGCPVGDGLRCPVRDGLGCPIRLGFGCPVRDDFGRPVRLRFGCAVRDDRAHQARVSTDLLAAHSGLGGDSEHVLVVSNAPEHAVVLRLVDGGDDAVPAGSGGAYSDGVLSHGELTVGTESALRVFTIPHPATSP
jgi:hypothetical protein